MKKLGLIASVLVVPIALLLWRVPVHASTQDFVIKNFDADYVLNNSDKQGHMDVTETIVVDFNDNNHGILRAIPQSYKNHKLQIKNISVQKSDGTDWQFSTYTQNGNLVMKIGNPSQTVTGLQTFVVHYGVNNVIGFYGDHDELYWDVNGDQWFQTFEAVSATLQIPQGLQLDTRAPECFTGAYSSTAAACTITVQNDSITTKTTSPLSSKQTLSFVVGFQKEYFEPSTKFDIVRENMQEILKVVLPALLIGGFACIFWILRGRDAKGRGVIVPQYQPLDGLGPLETGSLIDFKTNNTEFTAVIIDLAIRGYIKIIESKKDRLLLKDKLEYTFELVGKDTTGLPTEYVNILTGMFGTLTPTSIAAADLKDRKFYVTVQSVQKNVSNSLKEQGYYQSDPLKKNPILQGLLVAIFIGTLFAGRVLGFSLILGLVIGMAILSLFIAIMPSRTAKGAEAVEYIKGLKLYLELAEKDRLKFLQGPNAQYAQNYSEPVKTVELYEKLLPYAIVLGVETEWSKQFESIYTMPPDWYQGNWHEFNSVVFVGAIQGSLQTALTPTFQPPSSSGSSGFGGGFAGGGGGGGGGGGW